MSVREKMLSTDVDAWNHPRRAMVGAGLSGGLGALVGSLWVPHVVESPLPEPVVTGLVAGCTVLLGLFVLALVD